jgi:hypothetical protein
MTRPPQTLPGVAYAYLDQATHRQLEGHPILWEPTECDIATRELRSRCQQCKQPTHTLWYYHERMALCHRCATSRINAGTIANRNDLADFTRRWNLDSSWLTEPTAIADADIQW